MSLFPDEYFNEVKTKRCKKCDRDLPLNKFSNASGGNYLRTECKDCGKTMSKLRKRLRCVNPLADPESHTCPICRKSYHEVIGMGGQKCSAWVMDHDHVSGKHRGYICHSCNRGLGVFHDSVELLTNAIEYLKMNSHPKDNHD